MDFPENKHVIDKYIQTNEKCKQRDTIPITLEGKLHILDVYLLPLDYLYFNIRNGRFKSEYLDLVQKNGGKELDPKNKDDANKIKEMLLSLDPIETRRTMADIQLKGQMIPGIITEDGFVIDGNRRLSLLSELSKKDSKFNQMKVAKLPSGVKPNDLWKLEAGIQLSKEQILRYGPINEMLKLQEGIDAGLTPDEIAKTLYGYDDDKEIVKKLERLKLVEEYLKFVGAPKQYKYAKNSVEHFIDLQSILEQASKRIEDPELRKNIKFAVFGLIQDKLPHRDLRRIKNMILNDSRKSLEWITKIADASKPTQIISPVETTESDESKLETEVDSSMENQDDEIDEDLDTTPRKIMYSNAIDALNADTNRDDVPRLLARALTNLDAIDYNHEELNTTQSREMINQILRHAEKLKTKLED